MSLQIVIELFRREVEALAATRQASVLTGGLSHEEYLRLCGELRGLTLAHDALKEALHKAKVEDDDD